MVDDLDKNIIEVETEILKNSKLEKKSNLNYIYISIYNFLHNSNFSNLPLLINQKI